MNWPITPMAGSCSSRWWTPPNLTNQDQIDGFVPVRITEVKTTGNPKYVKGTVLNLAEAPNGPARGRQIRRPGPAQVGAIRPQGRVTAPPASSLRFGLPVFSACF